MIPSRRLKHSSEFEFREAPVLHPLEDVGAQLQFPFPPVWPRPPRQLLPPQSLSSALPNTRFSGEAPFEPGLVRCKRLLNQSRFAAAPILVHHDASEVPAMMLPDASTTMHPVNVASC